MKSHITYVDASLFEAIIAKHGLTMTLQKGFVKVDGPTGRRVYVAATKRVGRVDISGFKMLAPDGSDLPGFVPPHMGEAGNVKQQLDCSLGEADILANFELLLTHMESLAPAEKAERKAAAPKEDDAKGWSKATLEGRKARIKKAAKKVAQDAASSPPSAGTEEAAPVATA